MLGLPINPFKLAKDALGPKGILRGLTGPQPAPDVLAPNLPPLMPPTGYAGGSMAGGGFTGGGYPSSALPPVVLNPAPTQDAGYMNPPAGAFGLSVEQIALGAAVLMGGSLIAVLATR